MIHPTAIVHKDTDIASNVEIGPYSIIGPKVSIGDGCILHNHVHIEKNTRIGKNCTIWPFASVGSSPQDLSFQGEETWLEIGDNCMIRESATISRGTMKEQGLTSIGNNVLLMACAHVGHDCRIGNNVVIANYAGITGHVTIQDHVVFGGLAGAHQFIQVGEGAIVSGGSMCTQDIFPYSNAQGDRAYIRGLNHIGLKRRNTPENIISLIKKAYHCYFSSELSHEQAIDKITELYNENNIRELQVILNFLKTSKRGLSRSTRQEK